ncbi:hypothetical protein KDL44_04255 [bacterium]|nr:hypothetical protein [bacterium]
MRFSVEYMFRDVSAVELGQLGELISTLRRQGWQPLEEAELQSVSQMLGDTQRGSCLLWMKRSVPVDRLAAAA